MADLKYIGKNILTHDLILKKGDVSGSASSTGSFGNLNISDDASITGNMVVGGRLTAQEIHTEIESASIIFTSGSTKFGDTSDDTHEFTGSILVKGNLTAENLTADSSSVSTRLTTEEGNVDALQTDSGSFSTRVTNLKSDSGSFSTRVTDLKSDSGSFSTRVTNLKSDSGSFSTRITNFSTGNVELVSGSSTSTGSFGRIETAGNLEMNSLNPSVTLASIPHGGTPVVRFVEGTNFRGGFVKFDGASNVLKIGTHEVSDSDASNDIDAITMARGTGIVTIPTSLVSDGDVTAAGYIAGTGAFASQKANILNNFNNFIGLVLKRTGTGTADFLRLTDSSENIKFSVEDDGKVFSAGDISASNGIFGNNITAAGNVSGSSTSTGSFGHVIASGDVSVTDHIQATRIGLGQTNTSNTSAVVIEDKHLEFRQPTGNDGGTGIVFSEAVLGDNSFRILHNGAGSAGNNTLKFLATNFHATNPYMEIFRSGKMVINSHITGDGAFISGSSTSTGSFGLVLQNGSELSTFLGAAGTETLFSGSATSTGSFGRLETAGVIIDNNNVSATSFTGIFQGALSGSAQIASNISGAFAVASASFAADILSNSSSFATRITSDSSSFAARDTLSEATSSKILNGELEFTNITGSGHISMSLSSTGSFGRVSVTTLGGHSPIVIDGETTFVNSITSSAHVSSSMTSTASFGRVNVVALGGHQSLTVDPITTFTNVITASSAVKLDGKVFIQTGSIEGDLHVSTADNIMRIGKSTSGLIVSGSESISRFATGSDGSIIDLGFTVTDEDGNVVLAGDGDGIHVDSNNYWYNNKFYKIGDGVDKFLEFDNVDLKYKGQVFASTGSIDGELFIKSPTGSMFIGKFTGGLPSSGSGNISRFATGSDGSIIDLGFTTTDESGETVFLTTGDGLVVDANNYWYTTGHFKIGDTNNFINWNTSNLTVSGTFTGDGSGLTGLSSFDGSAGTETLFSGSAVSTGSFGIIENNTQIAGFRPIINQTADFSASLSNAGRYHIVHGNLTCSIGTDASMPVTIGAEYEFFQSSSVGKFLFQTGSGVSLLSKNDNKNIAGQHSGATLKKVAANTFHLVGDLT